MPTRWGVAAATIPPKKEPHDGTHHAALKRPHLETQTSNPTIDGLSYSLSVMSASRLHPSMSLASLRLHSPWRTSGIARRGIVFAVAPRVRTRLLVTRYQVLDEPSDSRIATKRLRGEPGILTASIMNLACIVIVSSAVQFDSQLCAWTIKIQDVPVERVLAANL